jgi:hypothetical protein
MAKVVDGVYVDVRPVERAISARMNGFGRATYSLHLATFAGGRKINGPAGTITYTSA